MQSMKYLVFTVALLVLIQFSGILPFMDSHVFAWIPSLWIVYAQEALLLLLVLSIFAYATLYIYYASKHR
jgi:hypothetical protein